jgi:hypothetical protein
MLTDKVAILFKSLPAFFVAGRIPACRPNISSHRIPKNVQKSRLKIAKMK